MFFRCILALKEGSCPIKIFIHFALFFLLLFSEFTKDIRLIDFPFLTWKITNFRLLIKKKKFLIYWISIVKTFVSRGQHRRR